MKTLYAALLITAIGLTNHCNAVPQKNMVDKMKTFFHKKGLRSKKSKRIVTGVACVVAAGTGASSIALVCYLWDRLHADKKTNHDKMQDDIQQDAHNSSSQSTESDQSNEQLDSEEMISDDESKIEEEVVDPIKKQEQLLVNDLYALLNNCLKGANWGITINLVQNKRLNVRFYGDAKIYGNTAKMFKNQGYKKIFQDWAKTKENQTIKSIYFYFHDNEGGTLKEKSKKPTFHFSLSNTKNIFTVLSSPHIDKKSREQFIS